MFFQRLFIYKPLRGETLVTWNWVLVESIDFSGIEYPFSLFHALCVVNAAAWKANITEIIT